MYNGCRERWFVFDYDNPKFAKSHDLIKLFERLKPESQAKPDAEYKRSVVPYHPNRLFMDYNIRHMLYQHKVCLHRLALSARANVNEEV